MEPDRHNKHTRAAIKTIDQFLSKDTQPQPQPLNTSKLSWKLEKETNQLGSSFLSSKIGSRTYLEQRLGSTILDENRPQDMRGATHTNY